MLQQAKKRFLLAAPIIALPFLCGIFYALGGGHGGLKATDTLLHGLNTELPGAFPDPRKVFLNKVGAYQKADLDSQRKQEYAQQDPYLGGKRRKDSIHSDPKANELLLQLNRLKATLQQPPPVRNWPVYSPPPMIRQRVVDTPGKDPQLERLNTMLDKVIRIQHPEE